jgi:hypothetical protein
MKLATYEVYNSHGHTRTHTDAHAQRERAGEGGRSERGALIEREIARARKNGIRIHVDVYKYAHTHTHTHTHLHGYHANTGRAEEICGHTAGYRRWHSQSRKTRRGQERGGWVCSRKMCSSKMSKTKIRQTRRCVSDLTCTYGYTPWYSCRYMSMHIHTYMRIHIHIYICTHTHIHR